MKKARSFMIPHPGEYIREELDERGWTQRDLAYILGRKEQSINPIISGKRGITADMAKALGEAFDVSPELFINLQREYDLARAQEPDPGIAKRAQFFRKSFPVRTMFIRGWLDEDTNPNLLEAQMARFFEVDDVTKVPHLKHAAKRTEREAYHESIPAEQLTWLFRVRQIAASIHAPKYSHAKLKKAKAQLKQLMTEPEEVRHVPRILMECGVVYVVVEKIPKAKIDGVCFWFNDTPVIGMSLRYDRIDNFWFVLMHEIEHVLQKHAKEREIIDTLEGDSADPNGNISPEEKVANAAASEFCIARDKMHSFYLRKKPYFSEEDVLGFAKRMHVHPGIVVGQLHFKADDYRPLRKHLVGIKDHLLPSALVDGWGQIAPVSL